MDFSSLTIIVPEGNDRGVVEGTNAVDIIGCLKLLDYNFRFLIIRWSFLVVIELGLVQFCPFSEIYAVFTAAIAGTLHCHYLIGVFVHWQKSTGRGIEGRIATDEDNRHGWPLDIKTMEHIVSVVVKL